MSRLMSRVAKGRRTLVVWALGLAACDPSTGGGNASPRAVERGGPDDTLRTHIIEPSTPTDEGLVYLRAIADVHERADALAGEARVDALRAGLGVPVPAGLAEAEILRLDLAARLGEELMQAPRGAAAARELLGPMLAVERSLPLDRATARALIVLGDAAVRTGDDALAAGSYARSIEVMSLLSQELRQELEP
ncbi:hypothetical protein [Paraliomyxa miuraensis]|uniref:hypothetical protein n=1 Tax=Paraliomyxa miuraensis TaxID=376150 RepID=UPI002257134B|nr:hypothetical protein [Paraliomyxa miuraensis]MCX4245048.1 hypothetical protein [Paraliomyxa miuraensis]